MRNLCGLVAITAGLLMARPALSGEWPAFRGPVGDGTSKESNVPLEWTATRGVLWKVAVPGKGHSSPIIWGDSVFLTSCVDEDRLLLCFDRRDGKVVWKETVLTAPLEKMHRNNSAASATPVTDGRHVWVTFQAGADLVAACYDVRGKRVWKRAVGPMVSQHGFASSPVLFEDLLIVNGDSDGEAFLAGLDKASGKERWRTERPNRTRSFSTPLFIEVAGRKQVVLSGSKSVAAYEPASGKQLWVADSATDKFVATVAFADGVVFATGTSPNPTLVGIRPDGSGNVTETHVLWKDTRGAAYVPSPVAFDKFILLVSDSGVASCIEARTGKRAWSERLGAHHDASPLLIGKHLYCLADDGTTFVLKAGPTFEVVQRNPLGEECHATPAVSNGQLFIRSTRHLFCIGDAGSGMPVRTAP